MNVFFMLSHLFRHYVSVNEMAQRVWMSRANSVQCFALKFPLLRDIHLSSYKSIKTFTSLTDQISDDFHFRVFETAFDDGVEVAIGTLAPRAGKITLGEFVGDCGMVGCTGATGTTMRCWEGWLGARTTGAWTSGADTAKPRGNSNRAACMRDENVFPNGDIDEG
ncbi:hypothetical protein L7F22_023211 [Adiantum nelumboides]|nr:hypothetical protein [Adiantum nelumboides]